MPDTQLRSETTVEHFDVPIVGAGLSARRGLAPAGSPPGQELHHPEGCEASGTGIFSAIGVRPDPTCANAGYRFRPWKDAKEIADGPAILIHPRSGERPGIDAGSATSTGW